jgi:hypothetical protein
VEIEEKMKLTIEIKPVEELSLQEEKLMNKHREIEFGKNETRNFKEYYPGADFIFIRQEARILGFGTLRPITLDYRDEKIEIIGICNIVSIEKGKDYGRVLLAGMMSYLKTKNKMGLGFCLRKNMNFYKKAGMEIKEDLIKKFIYKNPKNGEEIRDDVGDGFYYNDKDELIEMISSGKEMVYIDIAHW